MDNLANKINHVLPQTQCGLCDYNGCKPYAEAIASGNATINRCPPGGVRTLKKLATLTGQTADPFIAELTEKYKPPTVAVIREHECIGCTKCIQACPVDAIIGSAKKMHTVLTTECTGCDLCLPVCPVDCIDMISQPERSDAEQQAKSDLAHKRYEFHQQRLSNQQTKKIPGSTALDQSSQQRQDAIKAALARIKK